MYTNNCRVTYYFKFAAVTACYLMVFSLEILHIAVGILKPIMTCVWHLYVDLLLSSGDLLPLYSHY